MQVKVLSYVRNSIPYIKELRPLFGGPLGCILGQQLDYWFERYPKGFYKFMSPAPDRPDYREGDSWEEELGFSSKEFRTAFDFFGIRYKSASAFREVENPFVREDGSIASYCSVFNRRTGQTRYFRNHEYLDSKLQEVLFTVNAHREVTETPTRKLQKCPSGTSINAHRADVYTEPTPDPTPEPTPDPKKKESVFISIGNGSYEIPEDRRVKLSEQSGFYRVLYLPKHDPQGFVDFILACPFYVKDMTDFIEKYWDKIKPSPEDIRASIEDFPHRMENCSSWKSGCIDHPRKYLKNRMWENPVPSKFPHSSPFEQSSSGTTINVAAESVETGETSTAMSLFAPPSDRLKRSMRDIFGNLPGIDFDAFEEAGQ